MPRNVPAALAAHLARPTTTVCYLLKVTPVAPGAVLFGITTCNRDVAYDDGGGLINYRSPRGYTALDLVTRADLAVDNSEASGLLAEFAADGVTAGGIQRGDYDSARFVQYLVNFEDLTQGHVIVSSGRIGQVTNLNGQTFTMELRSLTQVLKQTSLIELTSITDRAAYGDLRNKMPLVWYASAVATVGVENDRDFTLTTAPGGGGAPGSASPVTGVFFFTGDGATTFGQLVDTAGRAVPAGFTLTSLKIDGAALATPADYTVDAAGVVAFVTAPASGAVGTWDGTLPAHPDGYFVPGVVRWLTGANVGRENEIETYVAATGVVTLVIPTREPIAAGDTLNIRRDSDKSKTGAIADDNLPNFRGEPELPRGNGVDLQAPTAR